MLLVGNSWISTVSGHWLGDWKERFPGVSFRSVLAFIAGYYLSVRLGEAAYGTLAVSSPFWLPNAVLLTTFLLTQKKHWALIAVAVFPIRLLAGAPLGTPLWFLLFSSADDLVTTLLAAWLLLRVLRRDVRLDTLRDFLIFLGIAAGIAPALAALIGAFGRHALGDSAVPAAYRWFLGNSLAQAIVTPTLLYWYIAGRQRLYPPLKELVLLSSGLMAVLLYAFLFRVGPYSPIFSYAPVPFIVWATLRLRPIGTATTIFLVACASMFSAAERIGLFSKGSPSQDVLSLQLFLLVVSVPLVSLSIVVDERKRAEETLRESEERFSLVANTAPVMIWTSGLDKLCNYANQRFIEFTGRSLEAELGNGWVDRIHLEDLERSWDTYGNAFDQRKPFQIEYRLRRHDGEYRWVIDSGVPRFNADDSFAGYIGMVIDVTERKLAEEAISKLNQKLIEAQEEERTRIARELHDDINQRLALLAISLERLRYNPPSKAEIIKNITEAIKQVQDLGSDVQALSHHLHTSKLEYLGLAAAAAGFCREVSSRQGVEIDFHSENISKDLPKEIQLSLFRVLQEAIQNATKHSASQHFEVSLGSGLTAIELTVRDSGIGFDPGEAMKGNGLGLTTIRERLKLVNGDLSIDSQPQRGTTLRARVPSVLRAKPAGTRG